MNTATTTPDLPADIRAARGLDIFRSKGGRIRHVAGEAYLCPSQSASGGYVVDIGEGTCSCADFETTGERCKHLYAVLIARGAIVVEGESLSANEPRKTYTQNWPAYDRAQCEEKARVQVLLKGLCDGITQPPAKRTGRPRLLLAELVYASAMKVFGTMSGRRSISDVRACERDGFIDHTPAHCSIARLLESPAAMPLLTQLVEESATPLRTIETALAADATGFSTSTFARWFDHKYQREKKVNRWVKLHAMTGTKTHVITAAVVTEGHVNDCPQLPALLDATVANGFNPTEISADKAYLSNQNIAAIEATGAAVYIPFKSNSNPTGNTAAWQRLFLNFTANRREFLAAYHKRSNVESVFSSVKRKFGGAVRSKLPAAQFNEVLLKCLCSNLSQVVHATFELGIEPKFWMPETAMEVAS